MEVLDFLFECGRNPKAFLSVTEQIFVHVWRGYGTVRMELVKELSNAIVHIYYFGPKQCGHLVFKHLAILVQCVTIQIGQDAR